MFSFLEANRWIYCEWQWLVDLKFKFTHITFCVPTIQYIQMSNRKSSKYYTEIHSDTNAKAFQRHNKTWMWWRRMRRRETWGTLVTKPIKEMNVGIRKRPLDGQRKSHDQVYSEIQLFVIISTNTITMSIRRNEFPPPRRRTECPSQFRMDCQSNEYKLKTIRRPSRPRHVLFLPATRGSIFVLRESREVIHDLPTMTLSKTRLDS